MPVINQAGLDLIKEFEGLRLQAYQDVGGVWTIGYGHTGGVSEGQQITETQAETMLETDLEYFEAQVNGLVNRNLTPNQFAALVSFAYNLGVEALRGSTLLADVNAGNFSAAQEQFSRWVYGAGEVLPGLVRRRAAEAALFGTP